MPCVIFKHLSHGAVCLGGSGLVEHPVWVALVTWSSLSGWLLSRGAACLALGKREGTKEPALADPLVLLCPGLPQF